MLGFAPLASAPVSAAGFAVKTSSLAVTEAKDAASVAVDIIASVSFALTEAQDTAAANAAIVASASLDATEAVDTASSSITATTFADLSASETQDSADISAQVDPATAYLDATEAQDIAAVSTAVVASADLTVTDAADTAEAAVTATTFADLIATETPDVADFTGVVRDACALAAVENQDVAAFATEAVTETSFAITEPADGSAAGVVVQWAVIPADTVVWTQKADGEAFWQSIGNALPPANTPRTGGAIALAPIAAVAISTDGQPPSTGAVGALWTQPAASPAYWETVKQLQPQANTRPTGCLGGAPLGGIAMAEGVADIPTENPGSAVWKPVSASFTPTQQAA